MKVINRKSEREKERIKSEKNSPAAILSRENNKRKQEELERNARIARVVLDWRVSGQLNPITKAIWAQDTKQNREKFLKTAIKNRGQLKELYVEPFEYNALEKIEVEYDKDTIEMLEQEATSNGLTLNEYVTSIVYTTAFNINQEREKARLKAEAEEKERTPYTIGSSSISQELKRKLDAKYGKPEMNTWFGLSESAYTDMLIDLAEEYFDIKK